MNTEINKLLSRIKLFSLLWTVGGCIFLFNIFFPEVEYYGFQHHLNILSVAFIVIGLVGAIWFVKCPQCKKKLLLESINERKDLNVSSWINDVKSHECFVQHER